MPSDPKKRRRRRRDEDDAGRLDAPRDLKRDLGLYWRVVSRVGGYKFAAILTVVCMSLEAAFGVVSLGMIQPVLSVIFEEKPLDVARFAKKHEMAFSAVEGSTADYLIEGYFFLRPQVEEAAEAIAKRPADAPPANIRFGRIYLASEEARGELAEMVGDRASVAALGTATTIDEAPAGEPDFPKAPRLFERTKMRMVGAAEKWVERAQARKTDNNWRYTLLWWIVGAIIGMTVLKVIAAFFAAYLGKWLGFAVIRDMQQELYGHSLDLDFQFFENRAVGDLISRVTSDLHALHNVVSMLFTRFFQAPVKVAFHLAGLIFISWQLTAISLLAILPVSSVLLYFTGRVRKASRRIQKHRADIADILQETYNGVRTVKAYAMEDYERARFAKRNEQLFKQQNKASKFEEISSQMNEVILMSILGGLVLFGGYYVLAEQAIKGADFLVFLALLGSMWGPVRSGAKSFVKVQQGLVGAERVFEIMDTRPTILDAPGAVDCDAAEPSIEFRGVRFSYAAERTEALKGVDLVAPAGKVVALAGKTGSGKSTLACMVPRFYQPSSGEVKLGGTDVRAFKLASLRSKIAFVSQQVVLFDDSIRANIAYGRPDIPLEKVVEAAKAANIHDEILAMPQGYDTPVGGQGVKLSGGQRQRVAVARALLKNAPVLILDEATSALDVETERLVQEALDRLMSGRTTIVIAHRLSTIRGADMICFLKDGEIVERGGHDELIASDGEYARYHRLHEREASGERLGSSSDSLEALAIDTLPPGAYVGDADEEDEE